MVKKYVKKIDHDDAIDAMRYSYLSFMNLNLLKLHKDNKKVQDQTRLKWFENYMDNSMNYELKSLKIMNEMNVQYDNLVGYGYNLEEDEFYCCLKEK